MLENIILGFLIISDMSGYDIKRFMEQSIAYFYDASFGSIYPMLKKLEETGMVTAVETVDGGKYRKEYSITDRGKEAFFAWLNQPITLNRARHDHLVRIFFYRWLPPARAKELISGFIETIGREIRELEHLKEKIHGGAGVFELGTLDYGQQYYRFTLHWCEEFLGKIDQLDRNAGNGNGADCSDWQPLERYGRDHTARQAQTGTK